MLFNTLPSIVMLHYVSDDAKLDPLKPWVISQSSFLRLLNFLESEGYTTLTVEDLLSGTRPGRKSIIITFDDCPKHLFDFAIPELLKRNMKAVFYMPTAYLGGYNVWGVTGGMPRVDLMDEKDIKRLVDMGMEVGSHSHQHLMLSDVEEGQVIEELKKSKEILEKIIDKPVLSIAYPYGDVPAQYGSIVKSLNYKLAFSVYAIHDSKYAIRRWIYGDSDNIDSIKWKLSRFYNLNRFFSDKYNLISKRFAQRLYRYYASLRTKLTPCIGAMCIGIEDILPAL